MVVEFLTFRVPSEVRDAWIEREGEVWSTWLEQRPGFVRKELWESADDPDELHAVIWWDGYEPWHTITAEQVAAVDAEMGDLLVEPTLATYHVTRPR